MLHVGVFALTESVPSLTSSIAKRVKFFLWRELRQQSSLPNLAWQFTFHHKSNDGVDIND